MHLSVEKICIILKLVFIIAVIGVTVYFHVFSVPSHKQMQVFGLKSAIIISTGFAISVYLIIFSLKKE